VRDTNERRQGGRKETKKKSQRREREKWKNKKIERPRE
jgi:hypothetical protein